MAGLTKMKMAIKALKHLDGKLINLSDVKFLISSELSSSHAGIANYLHMLDSMGIIREEKPFKMRIKIPEDHRLKKEVKS